MVRRTKFGSAEYFIKILLFILSPIIFAQQNTSSLILYNMKRKLGNKDHQCFLIAALYELCAATTTSHSSLLTSHCFLVDFPSKIIVELVKG